MTDTGAEDKITDKSQKHSLSNGDKLLCGGSLREVTKDGFECTSTYASPTRHIGLMVSFKKNGAAVVTLQRY